MRIVIRLFLISLLGVLSTINLAQADSNLVNLKPAKPNAEVLFVLLSQQASIHAIANKPDVYRLTLRGVNPKVIYFSDRPSRISNQMSTEKFIEQWTTGNFKDSAPNAVMEAVRLNAKTKILQKNESSYPIILKHPIYQPKTNQLSFEIKALPGSPLTLPKAAHSDYVAIFIDGVCLTCIGG